MSSSLELNCPSFLIKEKSPSATAAIESGVYHIIKYGAKAVTDTKTGIKRIVGVKLSATCKEIISGNIASNNI